MNIDLFGYTPPGAVFRDIRSTRPSVAEQKAQLCLVLSRLVNRIPEAICSASVNRTREGRHHRDKALKVLSSTRSSVEELKAAIKQMESYK